MDKSSILLRSIIRAALAERKPTVTQFATVSGSIPEGGSTLMKTPHNNRRKVQMPKTGKGWCVCDRWYGGDTEKCPVCGRRNGRMNRLKKVPPSVEEFLG